MKEEGGSNDLATIAVKKSCFFVIVDINWMEDDENQLISLEKQQHGD